MRIAVIACAAAIGLAAGPVAAECNWSATAQAETSKVVAAATSTTEAAPAQGTPVRLPETDEQG